MDKVIDVFRKEKFMKKSSILIVLLALITVLTMPIDAQAKYRGKTTLKTCCVSGCKNKVTTEGSNYCNTHKCSNTFCKLGKYKDGYCSIHYYERERAKAKPSPTPKKTTYKTNTTSKKKTTYKNSYDDGYDDVYFDGDYDDDRYRRDPDYARGVDDAMDDEGWDW